MERDTSIDLIKLISIIMVIILHVSSNGFSSTDSFIWNGANFYESFTRTCVPLFFMATGSLLINRPLTIQSSAARIKRLVIPFAFWSLAYLIFFKVIKNQDMDVLSIFLMPAAGHLWYLYALTAVYLTLPIIGILYLNSTSRVKYYILSIWFFSCVLIPTLKSYNAPTNPSFDLSTLGLYQGYFFAGAVLSSLKMPYKFRWLSFLIFLIASITILLSTRHFFVVDGLHDVRNYLNSSVLVCVASISLFITLKGVHLNSSVIKYMLAQQSRYTFGIYLIHLALVYAMGEIGFSISKKNVFYFIPLSAAIIYFLSLASCFLIYKARAEAIIS